MKYRLLNFIRCPICRLVLKLEDQVVQRLDKVPGRDLANVEDPAIFQRSGYEVTVGSLLCPGCGHRYAIDNGVPRLCPPNPEVSLRATVRTASSYGYLWDRSTVTPEVNAPRSYHFDRMEEDLSLPPFNGLILDAGCGDGIDLANLARRAGVEIVGVELSDGGCWTSFERSFAFPSAHVVQADICRLPFDDDSFDFVYSYGVLHHLPAPKEGLQELVRVLKPEARLAAYFYEDFSERGAGWRVLRPGGRFAFAEPNMLNPQIAVQKNIPAVKQWLGDTPDETALIPWKIRKQAGRLGFVDVSVQPHDFLHPLTPSRLIGAVKRLGTFLERLRPINYLAGSLLVLLC
jgi:SAM-dependent methyltransferase/uncharacterized protein YbaR (Trm112 family)